jgi:hypothetical protein
MDGVFVCTLRWCGLWLALAGLGAQPKLPPEALLDGIRQKMAENLARLPNYTCRQTIERTVRPASSRRFQEWDTLRLEVAFVGGKELYAWPGATRFEEKSIHEMVGGGTVGSGNFALHAAAIFRTKEPIFTGCTEDSTQERRAIRCDFRVPRDKSAYIIRTGARQDLVGYHGSFWADAATLDLMRLEVDADDIPPELKVSKASDRMVYGRMRIGDSSFLLPQSSELSMVDEAGNENRNRTRFDQCRQYLGESVVTFAEPVSTPVPAKPAGNTPLAAGLWFDIQLEAPIEVTSAAIGDPLSATLTSSVKKGGEVVVPKGARLRGRITHIWRREFRSVSYLFIGFQFNTLEFENSRSDFLGALENVAGPGQYFVAYGGQTARPGEGVLGIKGAPMKIPSGLRMSWRTLGR